LALALHCRCLVFARGLVVAIVVFASRVADASDADPFEMAVELTVSALHPSLGDARFAYQGPLRDGGMGSLNATGRDIGVAEPTLTVYTISAGPRFRWATFRFVMDWGLGSGDAQPVDAAAAVLVEAPASIGMVGIAAEPGLSLRQGSLLVELRGHLGARWYGVALPGFQDVVCRGAPAGKPGLSSGSSYPCTASTWIQSTSVAPTLEIAYSSREGDVRPYLGVTLAIEMVGVSAYAPGISIGFHFGTPPGAAAARRYRRRLDNSRDPLVFPDGWDDVTPRE
jgi:hypothetical protein